LTFKFLETKQTSKW